MGGGAVIALAAAARRQRMNAILDAFRLAGATAAERAQTLDLLELPTSRELDELSNGGILRPGSRAGTWFLDEAAYIAKRDAQPTRALRVVSVAIVVLLVLLGVLLINLVGRPQ